VVVIAIEAAMNVEEVLDGISHLGSEPGWVLVRGGHLHAKDMSLDH
jgi:hypothetical protein